MKHAFVIIMFGLLMSYGVALDVLEAQTAAAPPTTGSQSSTSAQIANAQCVWRDSKTGQIVPSVPAGGAERELNDPNRAYNPVLGRNYFMA